MNFLKSIYVMLYITALIIISIFAGMKAIESEHVIAWLGVLLTTAPFMTVLMWMMAIKNISRTSSRLPIISIMALIGLVMTLWSWNQQQASFLAVKLAAAGLIGFLIYSYWYSSFAKRSSKIMFGKPLPSFSLQNTKGDIISSANFIGQANVIMFYRGNWCPLCMAQIKKIAAQYKALKAANVRVILVSPQPHKNTISLAKKFDAGLEFYTDEGNKTARALGIKHSFGVPMGMQALGYDSETVLPTVVITDAKGKVIWLHETDNYRIRPDPKVFLEVLHEHGIG